VTGALHHDGNGDGDAEAEERWSRGKVFSLPRRTNQRVPFAGNSDRPTLFLFSPLLIFEVLHKSNSIDYITCN
jgi:hypothetical protein